MMCTMQFDFAFGVQGEVQFHNHDDFIIKFIYWAGLNYTSWRSNPSQRALFLSTDAKFNKN